MRVQEQVLDLIEQQSRELDLAVLFITHDLSIVAGLANRVAVMYRGDLVEQQDVEDLFAAPRHPYTKGLIGSVHGVGTIVTDVDVEALAQVYRLRMELAPLLGKLDPAPLGEAGLDRIRAMIGECDTVAEAGDARAFLRLNMAFVQEVNRLTGNLALREISERLYIQVARVVLKMMPELGLAAEFRAFRNEMEEVLAAAEIGDWDAIGHIRRAHISMSFTRMLRNARARHAEEPRAEP